MSAIPHDISRCEGTRAKLCRSCRRTEQGGRPQWYIVPHVDRSGCCQDYIAKNEESKE